MTTMSSSNPAPEAVLNAIGDNDFQDVVISIHTNADGLFIL